MTEKGRTTVWIDKEKAERVRADLGIDLSTLASQALDIVDSQSFDDIAIELRLAIIDKSLAAVDDELQKVTSRLASLQKQQTELVEKREEIIQRHEEIKYTIRLQEYTYQLNSLIITCRYDMAAIVMACQDVLVDGKHINLVEKITELNPLWKLEVHVAEFKKNRAKYG